ncbi:cytochrome b5-like heme/Steroid binding domain-containing protein [Phthorimaea operculella]|nr:cytochrome b5-like heme/Steroid binding domain-containing protein [Phthorimaea operculella]
MCDTISRAEVKKHKSPKSCWIIIHNSVYDVSKFLSEHPGGEDTLLGVAGTDATQAFEDVGHSDDARILLKNYKIGCLPADEGTVEGHLHRSRFHLNYLPIFFYLSRRPRGYPCEQGQKRRWWLYALLALGIAAGGAFAYKKYGGGGGA